MHKFTALTAALAVSALVVAPATAADLRILSPNDPMVRISVAGKSPAQLTIEIKAAAQLVCSDKSGLSDSCVDAAIDDATDQLAALTASHHLAIATQLQVSRDGPESVRVSLTGKSPAQIDHDIQAAAAMVCKDQGSVTGVDADCVEAAIGDARLQLRSVVAQIDTPRQLASN